MKCTGSLSLFFSNKRLISWEGNELELDIVASTHQNLLTFVIWTILSTYLDAKRKTCPQSFMRGISSVNCGHVAFRQNLQNWVGKLLLRSLGP